MPVSRALARQRGVPGQLEQPRLACQKHSTGARKRIVSTSVAAYTLPVDLLERAHFLETLGEYAADARSGRGRLVLLAGEAGVGKTSVLEQFRARHLDLRLLWGACDGSFTPRPLGPLYEMATTVGGRLLELCADGADRRQLFATFLDELGASVHPTVVVIEDLHWADDATLDWLRHLARRIAGTRAMVVASYRDDEPGTHSPLAEVIGQIATHRGVRRMSLPPLTPDAVRQLAGDSGRDIDELYRLTGGVPFYVGEVLNAEPGAVPRTVADVVSARVSHLSEDAARLVLAAAVLGGPAQAGLLAAVSGSDADALDECVESGTLVGGLEAYRFRHELTRLAVEQSIPALRRGRIHAAALAALHETAPNDHARLAYHADGAGDGDQALRHAARAAADAVAMRSHREAVLQYQRALRWAQSADDETKATLHEGLATSLGLMDRWEESADQRERALVLRRGLGDPIKISENLRSQAKCLWRLCRGEESEQATEESFALMATAPDSVERAWVYALYSAAQGDGGGSAKALVYAQEALRQAESLGCPDVLAHALNTIGVIRLGMGHDGFPELTRSIDLALDQGCDEQAARGYANLYQVAADRMRIAEYEWCFQDGMRFCVDNDLHTYTVCLRGSRTTALLRLGRLSEAVEVAEAALGEPASPVNRLHLLIPLSSALARLGDPRAADLIEEARGLAIATKDVLWPVMVAAVRAEAAWLAGRRGGLDERDVETLGAADGEDPWIVGELAVWLDRCGRLDRRPSLPAPYATELDGDFAAAAEWWQAAGCPFEQAVTLTRSGQAADLRRALELFTSIAADPAAALARRLLRQAGAFSVPRGPRPGTRSNVGGLTSREAEVLGLLRDGLTNAAISDRLVISERTVHHHVSAVLRKLGVRTRAKAVHEADRLAVAAPNEAAPNEAAPR